jgi:hypothetical protein
MGCDIHIITEINAYRGDNTKKWMRVPEIPEALKERNYSTFALIGDVRNAFNTKPFPTKGIPNDISALRFDFCDARKEYEGIWNNENHKREVVKLPGISVKECCLSPLDKSMRRECTREEYEAAKAWKSKNYSQELDKMVYTVQDPSVIGGELVKVTMKELYDTFEEFWDAEKEHCGSAIDPHANEYGYWKIDFSDENEDFHSHNHITLHEMKTFDYSDYKKEKVRIPNVFYAEFKKRGGELPDGMEFEGEPDINSIVDAFRAAFNPETLVSWDASKEKPDEYPMFKGIKELEAIASMYGIIDDNDIRIVFAFDN